MLLEINKKIIGVFYALCSLFLFPLISYAATPTDFKSLVQILIKIMTTVIPVIGGLAILFFFWGIAKYIFSAGNEEQKTESKSIMTWGLVAIFVMFSFYGILAIFGTAVFPNFGKYQYEITTPF